jgi:hypothetical protein
MWKLTPLVCTCGDLRERPTTDRIGRIREVVEGPTPRWTFEAGMSEVAHEALAILRHEVDEQMAHSQYSNFPS